MGTAEGGSGTGAAGAAAIAVLQLRGDVDALTQSAYRVSAGQLLESPQAQRLVVDMSEVSTIDSSGLGLLVHLHSITRARDVAMVLAHVPPRAHALLKRTGLDRVFTVEAP